MVTVVSKAAITNFVNFETAPVHPISLGPDRRSLAICNLPDARVELFDVSAGVPAPAGSVPVGCGFCQGTDQGRGFVNIADTLRSGTEGGFKTAQLRSLVDKVGMHGLSTNSRAGFGFMHAGSPWDGRAPGARSRRRQLLR